MRVRARVPARSSSRRSSSPARPACTPTAAPSPDDVEVLVGRAAHLAGSGRRLANDDVTGRLRVAAEDVDAVEVVAELLVVVVAARRRRPGTSAGVGRGGADHLRRRDRERLVGALLRRAPSTRTGCRAGPSPHRSSPCSCASRRPTSANTAEVPDHGDVVLARLDLGVRGCVGVQLRVVEVDHDLAAGEPATAGLAVEVLRRSPRPRPPNP